MDHSFKNSDCKWKKGDGLVGTEKIGNGRGGAIDEADLEEGSRQCGQGQE